MSTNEPWFIYAASCFVPQGFIHMTHIIKKYPCFSTLHEKLFQFCLQVFLDTILTGFNLPPKKRNENTNYLKNVSVSITVVTSFQIVIS